MSFIHILDLPASVTNKTRSAAHPRRSSYSSVVSIVQEPQRVKHREVRAEEALGHTPANRMTILSIGDDEPLLNTRQMVLESAGFRVRSISSVGAIEEAELRAVDLVLICHSVEEIRAATTARFLKDINPAISILQLCKGYGGRTSEMEQIAPYGPEQLLMEIEKTLQDKRKRYTPPAHKAQPTSTISFPRVP